MDNLKSIGGDLYICRNPNLTSLDALINLHSIGGGIYIYKNNALATLSGLDNIEEQSIDSLTILDNNVLSDCSVLSICLYLASPNGTINIADNTVGCNSQEEVDENCGDLLVAEDPGQMQCVVYPNPTDGIAHFTLRNSQCQWVTLNIFDMKGRNVISVPVETKSAGSYAVSVDLSALPPGIYY